MASYQVPGHGLVLAGGLQTGGSPVALHHAEPALALSQVGLFAPLTAGLAAPQCFSGWREKMGSDGRKPFTGCPRSRWPY